MPRSRGFTRGSHSSRRKTVWQEGPFGIASVSAAGTVFFTTGQTVQTGGNTMIRTRGELVAGLTLVTTANDGFSRVAFGLGIVTAEAFAIGVTAMPSPLDDITWPGWFEFGTFGLFQPVAGDVADSLTAQIRIPIDSKAMRKLDQGTVLFGAIEVADEVGAATLTAKLNTRTLLKLP